MAPSSRKVALLTREYPPDVYGGAGIHVQYLARELRSLAEVSVQCWGRPRDEPGVTAHEPWAELSEPKPESTALQAMSINLAMAAAVKGVNIVHSHTWYANLGGHLSKLTWSIPHVVTTHSLEPLRPWKAEQLGGGYALSTFCEQTAIEAADAVIAVSKGMREDVLSCYPKVDGSRSGRGSTSGQHVPGARRGARDRLHERLRLEEARILHRGSGGPCGRAPRSGRACRADGEGRS